MKIKLAAFLGPKDAAAFLARGNAWALKGEYDKAIRDFNQAIRLDPNDDDAFLNRSIARHAKGEYDKAIRDFNQAIRLNPELAVVLSALDVANTAPPR